MKRCNTCHILKPRKDYQKKKAAPDGLQYCCRSCMSAYDANRKPGRQSFKDAKIRAENKGIPFTITQRWFDLRVSIGHCEVTGMKFSKVRPEGAHSAPFVPSIDQIRPGEGYTDDNARVVCWCVNASMSTWPDEVFDAMCQARVRKIAQEKAEQHEQQEWIERVVQRAARLQGVC